MRSPSSSNALRDHDARIEVVVDGLAASAASIVAMAGEKITMNRASEVMVHDASTIVWGNAADLEEVAELLNKLSSDIAAIYADHAGGTVAEWREIMRGEAWFSAQEAVDAGLADDIVELKEDAEEAKNRFDLSIYAHAGRAHSPAPKLRATNSGLPGDSVQANEGARPEDGMTPEQLEKIGLPADATEEQINEKLEELASAASSGEAAGDEGESEAGDGEGTGSGESGDGTQTGDTGTGTETTQPQNFTPPPGHGAG
jgi:ClpP class serine protease